MSPPCACGIPAPVPSLTWGILPSLPSRGQVAVDLSLGEHRIRTVLETDERKCHWIAVDRDFGSVAELPDGEIGATKNPDTRQRRVEVAISKLHDGKRRPCCFDLSSCADPDVAKSGKLAVVS